MSVTADDYARAVEGVVADLQSFGKSLVGAYLYGSTARGEAKPGRSDVDVQVILDNAVWASREAYARALAVLEQVANGLVGSGVPFDGLLYTAADETRYLPLSWRPEFLSGKGTRLLGGKDVAADFDDPIPMPQILYEVLSLNAWAADCLAKDQLTLQERSEVAGLLDMVRKYVPPFACAAVGRPSDQTGARAALSHLFPDVDLSVLAEMEALRKADRIPESVEIKEILRRTFVLIEDLQRRITGRSG